MGGGDAAPGDDSGGSSGGLTDGWIDHIIDAYGVGRFLADLDAGRSYGPEGGVFGAVLAWVAGEGFKPTLDRLLPNNEFDSAQHWRNRHIVWALKGMGGG